MKVVEITWEDAWSSDDHWTAEEIKNRGPFLLKTVGYLVYQDKRIITLSAEHKVNDSDRHKHIIVIPKSVVRYSRVLK